ncbi:hypothetical protein SAMN05661093_01839 [Kibdelosporangium aridum]|uniref:Uncharacterized protein n=2 Tax=Kibdelosporangium aridum TaxID=2030 RepID=A0A1Y5X6F4_KIBAR|nr:hypothetical protein SAMN05661093_01839 [Kibdelosporangium aridum]
MAHYLNGMTEEGQLPLPDIAKVAVVGALLAGALFVPAATGDDSGITGNVDGSAVQVAGSAGAEYWPYHRPPKQV